MSGNEWHRSAIRAFQAWPLLTFAARHHQLFTYQELGEHLGLPPHAVGPDALHLIAVYCGARGLPLLNVIVVGKDSGQPEYDLGDRDVAEEQAKVFNHTWTNKIDQPSAVPSIEDFEQIIARVAAA